MKTKIISLTLAAVLTVTTVGVFAGSPEPRIRLAQMEDNVLHLYMDSLDQTAKFTIFDEHRFALYEETSEQLLDVKKRFDLSKLPEGDYTFEIEIGNKVQVYSFKVEDHVVKVSDEIEEVYSPTILFRDDLLGISLLNPKAKDVKILIFDHKGNELISDMHQEKQNVAVRYNLTQLPMGTYTLIVKANDRTYLKNILL